MRRSDFIECGYLIFAVHVGFILSLSGCSNRSLIEVTGEVTLDDKSVEQGIISFWPEDGLGPSAQGLIQEDKYKLDVSSGVKKVGIEVVKQTSEYEVSPGGPKVPVNQAISPAHYRDPQKTDLRCEVSAGSKTHTFRLKSS